MHIFYDKYQIELNGKYEDIKVNQERNKVILNHRNNQLKDIEDRLDDVESRLDNIEYP